MRNREYLLCTLLDCGYADLAMLDDVGYDINDIAAEARLMFGDICLNSIIAVIFQKGLSDLEEAFADNQNRIFDEIDLFNSHIPCIETNTENLVINIDNPLEFLSDLRILDKTTIKDKNSNRLLFKGINFNCEKCYAMSINDLIGTKINLDGFNKSHYSITVQGRCYSDLSKLIDKDTEQIAFYSDRKMAMFVTSSFQYYISLIDGIYSNWNILVPNNAPVTRIEFDGDKFSEFTDVVKEHSKITKPVKNDKGRNPASVMVGYQDGILMNIHTPVYKTTDYLKVTKIEGNVEKLHIGVDSKFLQTICELYSKVGDGVRMDYWKSNSVLLFNFGKYSNVIAPINPKNFDDAKTIITDYEN